MGPWAYRIQLVRGPPLPQVPVFRQGQMVGEAAGRTLRVRVFPCRVYPACGTGRADPPKQTPAVRFVVSGSRPDLTGDCAGTGTPGGADRGFLHPAPAGA